MKWEKASACLTCSDFVLVIFGEGRQVSLVVIVVLAVEKVGLFMQCSNSRII